MKNLAFSANFSPRASPNRDNPAILPNRPKQSDGKQTGKKATLPSAQNSQNPRLIYIIRRPRRRARRRAPISVRFLKKTRRFENNSLQSRQSVLYSTERPRSALVAGRKNCASFPIYALSPFYGRRETATTSTPVFVFPPIY